MSAFTNQSRGAVYSRKRRRGCRGKAILFLVCALGAAAAVQRLQGDRPAFLPDAHSSEGTAPTVATLAAPKESASAVGLNDPAQWEALQALVREDRRVEEVLEHSQDYPREILLLLLKNPEARDFALDYPNHAGGEVTGGLTESELSGGIPLLLQWDKRWGYFPYGDSVLGVTGCGPTCLAMVAAGLTGSIALTPDAVAAFSERSGYYVPGSGTSWELLTAGAASFGLEATEVPLWEDSMIGELNAGRPIIANLGPGDFTDEGHFIVIRGYENGMFLVNDPNSAEKSGEGWTYAALENQIKCLWSYRAA